MGTQSVGHIKHGQDLPCVTPAKPFLFFFSFNFLYYYLSPSIYSLTQQLFMALWALGPVETAVNKDDLVPDLGADRQRTCRRKQ